MKKKKPATKEFEHNSGDKRESFRYDFAKGKELNIRFKGKSLFAINISAGGLSFSNKGFNPLEIGVVEFDLALPDYPGDTHFSADLRILNIDEDNICHCIFEHCTLEQHELIHKYVLELQKSDLAH